jgi:hypothetical protein
VEARDALTDMCEPVRPLGAHPVADFLIFQDEGFGSAVQQHLVPLAAESAVSSCAKPSCSGTLHLCLQSGIGPTHGDIIADCVAKAFGEPIDSDPRALAILHEWVKTIGAEMNEARLRGHASTIEQSLSRPSHGENRDSSPLGSTNKIKNLLHRKPVGSNNCPINVYG